ncbi:MAG: hypothetical protein HQM10_09875 [Candidatus Riflebacteria bacterium]|nr:hypothetical protein [Candidatus Riflebacteria bacterium]
MRVNNFNSPLVLFWLICFIAFMQVSSTVLANNSNEALFDTYRSIYQHSSKKLSVLNYLEREFLFEKSTRHEVAGLEHLGKYDPQGNIGFCFGRAMAVELIALRMGLTPNSIGKMFIVGQMMQNDRLAWRFHVTAIIAGDNGKWFAIDPVMGCPLEIENWVKKCRSVWDREHKCYFYTTRSYTVIPDLSVLPDVSLETGKHLIEFSFRPEGKTGFESNKLASGVFSVNDKATTYYFSDAFENTATRFNFCNAYINDRVISYNSFFDHLLNSISSARDSEFLPGAMQTLARNFSIPEMQSSGTLKANHYMGNAENIPLSFKFDELLK